MIFLSWSLKEIDTFSQPIQLTFDNKKSYPTILGGFLSLIVYGICLALIISIGPDLIYKINPNISITDLTLILAPLINVTKENTIYASYFYDRDFNIINDPSILTFEIEYFKVDRATNGEATYNRISLKTTNCTDYYEDYKHLGFENDFKRNSLASAVCVDIKNNVDIVIGGSFADEYFYNILFRINKCKNSTDPTSVSTVCKSTEEINARLKGGYFEFFYIDKNVNITDYANPYISYFTQYFINIDPNAVKFVDIYFKTVNITSDAGLIFSEAAVNSSLVFDYYREQIDTSSADDRIIEFYINSSKHVLLYTRIYMKLQDFAAMIGGILEIMLIIGYFLSGRYNEHRMQEHMINHLYAFQDKDLIKRKSTFNLKEDKGSICVNETEGVTSLVKNDNKKPSVINDNYVKPSDTLQMFNQMTIIKDLKPIDETEMKNMLHKKVIFFKSRFVKKLSLNLKGIILINLCKCCRRKRNKLRLFDIALTKLNKYLDYLKIIRTLQEFNKLKKIVFTKSQEKLFSFYNKPVLAEEKLGNFDDDSDEHKEDVYYDLYQVFNNGLKKSTENKMYQKLISNFDEDLKMIYKQFSNNFN